MIKIKEIYGDVYIVVIYTIKVSRNDFLTLFSCMLYSRIRGDRMDKDYRQEIFEIFGTDDIEELKKLQNL